MRSRSPRRRLSSPESFEMHIGQPDNARRRLDKCHCWISYFFDRYDPSGPVPTGFTRYRQLVVVRSDTEPAPVGGIGLVGCLGMYVAQRPQCGSQIMTTLRKTCCSDEVAAQAFVNLLDDTGPAGRGTPSQKQPRNLVDDDTRPWKNSREATVMIRDVARQFPGRDVFHMAPASLRLLPAPLSVHARRIPSRTAGDDLLHRPDVALHLKSLEDKYACRAILSYIADLS